MGVIRIIKIAWLFTWGAIATLVLSMPIMAVSIISPNGNAGFELSRCWAWILIKATGVSLKIRHKHRIHPNQSYIIISNHQSHFDSLALVLTLGIPFRWVAKRELLGIPFFSPALKSLGTVFIDRSNRDKAMASIRSGVAQLPSGVSLIFFPEGTRSEDGAPLPFKKGGFITALETGWPILPVTVNGSRRVLPKGSLVFHSGVIEIVVGDPINSADFRPAERPRSPALELFAHRRRSLAIFRHEHGDVPLSRKRE